jgi:hypothetical protein
LFERLLPLMPSPQPNDHRDNGPSGERLCEERSAADGDCQDSGERDRKRCPDGQAERKQCRNDKGENYGEQH